MVDYCKLLVDARALQQRITTIIQSGCDEEIEHELQSFSVMLDVQKGYFLITFRQILELLLVLFLLRPLKE